MDCFRPNPNDLGVRAVSKAFQTAKSLTMKCEGHNILLCSRKGVVLQSIPLAMVVWSPCALPQGKDHCLSLQFKEPQTQEIVLKARNRRAVAQLAAQLDRAARQLPRKQPGSELIHTVHAVTHAPTDDSASNTTEVHETSRCTRCGELSRLIDEHEEQTQELEGAYSELEALRAAFEAAKKECSTLSSHLNTAESKIGDLTAAESDAKRRARELESCLEEATDRCEKLVQELKVAAQAADGQAVSCQHLQAKINDSEEEKKLLVAALTFAQAQLHDAQNAFKETNAQLSGASKSCSSAKAQATTARAELDLARQEAAEQAAAAGRAAYELKTTKTELKTLQESVKNKEQRWSEERAGMHEALTAAQRTSRTTEEGCYSELARLREETSILKQQLKDAVMIAQRVEIAENLVIQVQGDARRAQDEEEATRAVIRREADAFKAQAAEVERELKAKAVELDTYRSRAERAEKKTRELAERLSVVVGERNDLQGRLEEAEVAVNRARREKEIAETRCQTFQQERAGLSGAD